MGLRDSPRPSAMEEGAAGPKGQPGDFCVVGWRAGTPGPQEEGGQPQPCSHPREPLSLWVGPGNYSKPITPRRDLLVSPGQKGKHHTAAVRTEWLLDDLSSDTRRPTTSDSLVYSPACLRPRLCRVKGAHAGLQFCR